MSEIPNSPDLPDALTPEEFEHQLSLLMVAGNPKSPEEQQKWKKLADENPGHVANMGQQGTTKSIEQIAEEMGIDGE
jgi:hypothetical protein